MPAVMAGEMILISKIDHERSAPANHISRQRYILRLQKMRGSRPHPAAAREPVPWKSGAGR